MRRSNLFDTDTDGDEPTYATAFEDGIGRTFEIALNAATEMKGAELDADEIDEVLAYAEWFCVCLAYGVSIHDLATAAKAEARGSATVH